MTHATEHQPIPALAPVNTLSAADEDARLPHWARPYVTSYPDLGCWLWTGPRMRRYGGSGGDRACAPFGGNAARQVWTHIHGPIPAGLGTRHTCDNAMCVRPSHLLIGTPHANSQDAVARGRLRPGGRPARADGARPAPTPRVPRTGVECAQEACRDVTVAGSPVPLCAHHLRRVYEFGEDLVHARLNH